jgi:hypothetical protein
LALLQALLVDPHQVVLAVAGEEVLEAEALLENQRESGEGNHENHQRHD